MSAAEFDLKICKRLEAISNSYKQSAKRYEAAIDKYDETIKICERTHKKVKKTQRKRAKELNQGFQIIMADMRRSGLLKPAAIKDTRKPWY